MRQWQPKLGFPGERVEGLDEIEQSLRTVLTTPIDSVPSRPGFGSKLFELVDEPVNLVRPKVVKEVVRACAVSEPRLRVVSVEQTFGDDGHLEVEIEWHPTSDPAATRRTTVSI
jgi:phage baseplate assembly protein W